MDNKVPKDEMSKLPYIIAVDFDGTLTKEDCYPDIGVINLNLVDYLIEKKKAGCKIVLWTCRSGRALVEAVMICIQKGLVFDAVNENIKEVQEMFGNDTRKVYANQYIDDKAAMWR